MPELRVVSSYESLLVTRIAGLVSSSPPTIDVRGEHFTRATAVYIDEQLSPGFTVISDTRMYVQLPSENLAIRSVEVRSGYRTQTIDVQRFELSLDNVQYCSGVDRCIQRFLLVFLRSPGSDIFRPRSGGGALAAIGSAQGNREDSLAALVSEGIKRTEEYLIRDQSGLSGVPRDEMIAAVELVQLYVNKENGEVSPHIRITTLAGSTATATIS